MVEAGGAGSATLLSGILFSTLIGFVAGFPIAFSMAAWSPLDRLRAYFEDQVFNQAVLRGLNRLWGLELSVETGERGQQRRVDVQDPAGAGADELGVETGQLQAEGDRLGMDPVGSADAEGSAVFQGL